ncbi:hypothetical protein [Chlorobaculum sp. 24CR]|nr:hypothetical protein [Chlorobaculum sp. 24CR]
MVFLKKLTFLQKQIAERLIVAENLRKGAATNAVQIAELLVGNL